MDSLSAGINRSTKKNPTTANTTPLTTPSTADVPTQPPACAGFLAAKYVAAWGRPRCARPMNSVGHRTIKLSNPRSLGPKYCAVAIEVTNATPASATFVSTICDPPAVKSIRRCWLARSTFDDHPARPDRRLAREEESCEIGLVGARVSPGMSGAEPTRVGGPAALERHRYNPAGARIRSHGLRSRSEPGVVRDSTVLVDCRRLRGCRLVRWCLFGVVADCVRCGASRVRQSWTTPRTGEQRDRAARIPVAGRCHELNRAPRLGRRNRWRSRHIFGISDTHGPGCAQSGRADDRGRSQLSQDVVGVMNEWLTDEQREVVGERVAELTQSTESLGSEIEAIDFTTGDDVAAILETGRDDRCARSGPTRTPTHRCA